MAIDTIAKRFSMLNFGTVSTDLLPVPVGGFTQGARQHLLDGYSGIAWAGIAPPFVNVVEIAMYFTQTLERPMEFTQTLERPMEF